MSPLNRLLRTDKWFLGGGKGAIYAPPFPRHLDAPGFWDECFLADVKLQRLFTVLVVPGLGGPSLHTEVVEWRPDRLVLEHRGAGRLVRERRCVLPAHAWVCELELIEGPERVDAFVWSLQDVRPEGAGTPWTSLTACEVRPDAIDFRVSTRWPYELEPDRSATEREDLHAAEADMRPSVDVFLSFGAAGRRQGFAVTHAQTQDDSPVYAASVLPEKFRHGELPNEFGFIPGSSGMLHMLQHYKLERGRPLVVACGAGLSAGEARANLAASLEPDPLEQSRSAWESYLASVPQFECDDEFLAGAYWYRWYGLRLNTVDMPALPCLGRPFVTEGVGFFRNFVTYSAQAHLREACWMREPSLATGILDNLAACQRSDGSYPGHNYSGRPCRDFYHADFGSAAVQLQAVHPGAVRGEHIESLRRCERYFEEFRCTHHRVACVYDVFDQNETGQEYMSRYLFARPDADEWRSFRVSGVDATAYVADLQEALALLDTGDDARWRGKRLATVMGLASVCWDDRELFFCDVDQEGVRSPARPATGFYPYRSQCLSALAERLPTAALVEGLRRLLDPEEFWLPAGFSATSRKDPTFCAQPEWKGKRLNCPWNGRSWPMANSHLVDALANAARTLDRSLREKAGEALLKSVRLLFHEGDPNRPCVYEHFNPETGTPALYRGYDDYMHSWVADLVMRHAVGVQPHLGEPPALDPLPLGIDIECRGIPSSQGEFDVKVRNGKAEVRF
jgi:hypothetical protein